MTVVPGDGLDRDRAARVLTAVLQQPGGALSVISQLGTVPGCVFSSATGGGVFRRSTPARLGIGDWAFVAVDPHGVHLEARHVVKGVELQHTTVGPVEAGSRLAEAAFAAAADGGPEAGPILQSVLYGLSIIGDIA